MLENIGVSRSKIKKKWESVSVGSVVQWWAAVIVMRDSTFGIFSTDSLIQANARLRIFSALKRTQNWNVFRTRTYLMGVRRLIYSLLFLKLEIHLSHRSFNLCILVRCSHFDSIYNEVILLSLFFSLGHPCILKLPMNINLEIDDWCAKQHDILKRHCAALF